MAHHHSHRFLLALTVVGGVALAAGQGQASASTPDPCPVEDPGGFAGVLPDSAAGVVLRPAPGCGHEALVGVLPDAGGLATGVPFQRR